MRKRVLATPAVAVFALSACETTDSSYGYVANTLDYSAIKELIELSDQLVNDRSFEVYKSLFAPGYYIVDKSEKFRMERARISRMEHFEILEDLLEYAKEIQVYSSITDVEELEPGRRAKVTVQEDGLIDRNGARERRVSMVELIVGFEEGWVFFESATIIASQEIK